MATSGGMQKGDFEDGLVGKLPFAFMTPPSSAIMSIRAVAIFLVEQGMSPLNYHE